MLLLNGLTKPDRLTPEEYEVIKTHTTLGYDLCMKDSKLRPYALAALDHHEALDGSGYPNGISKKDIPYEAQIIRVADEYDAIVTKRQYTTHINISETLKDLIKDTKPDPKFLALDQLSEKEKLGKILLIVGFIITIVGFGVPGLQMIGSVGFIGCITGIIILLNKDNKSPKSDSKK